MEFMGKSLPIIGVVCDVIQFGLNQFHGAGEKYINAIAHGANSIPILLPSFGTGTDIVDLETVYDCDSIVDIVDGIFLTGSPTNIEPKHYGGPTHAAEVLEDRQRDNLSLKLIKKCEEKKIPILAVCRGFQEVNVALGGSLYQEVHNKSEFFDHRENKNQKREEQYDTAHVVKLKKGSKLESIFGRENFHVNSLHSQGIDTLSPSLSAEARSEDGLIEAFSSANANWWVVGVQWHPEWKFSENQVSVRLFSEFGKQIRKSMLLKGSS